MPVPTALTPPRGREINKGLLADVVYDRLLGDIIGGRYESEERLNVDGIAEEFGVSRTPVREALILLSASGFVEVVRNSRTQVSAWTVCDIRDRLEVVAALVCLTIADPRFDLADIVDRSETSRDAVGVASDAQSFLDIVEIMVQDGANGVAGYVLRELVSPLRLFLEDAVLLRHGIDLGVGRSERIDCLVGAIRASVNGDRGHSERLFADYAIMLAQRLSPRDGGPVSIPVSSSTAALRALR